MTSSKRAPTADQIALELSDRAHYLATRIAEAVEIGEGADDTVQEDRDELRRVCAAYNALHDADPVYQLHAAQLISDEAAKF